MIDTELLKEKVLDLAMHGKLVEQDPTEGSAKELLEEVKLERERLIEDKKIKKSKPLPEITEEEIPYEIPESWKWVRADELLLVTMGQSPKKETINSSKRGYEFHQGKSLFTNKYLGISDTYTEAENKVICSPAVIMSVRAPVGDVNLVDRDIFIGRGLAAFQTLGSVDINYIYYYLSTIKKDLEQVSTGSTFKAINSKVVRNICIPLPPAKEHKKIADQINYLFKVIDHLADQQGQFSEYQEMIRGKALDLAMQGKLVPQFPEEGTATTLLEEVQVERQKLVDEKKIKKNKSLPEIEEDEIPYEIPESWEWVRTDELLLVTMGQSPKKETINSNKQGYEFHQGKSLFTNKYLGISDTYTEAENKVICSPAVIMSVRAPVGDVNLVDRDIFIGRGLAAFQTLGSVDIEYIYYYLSTIKKDLERVSTGSTFKAINSTVVRNICIPVPPAKEQERIITKLDEINQVMHDKS